VAGGWAEKPDDHARPASAAVILSSFKLGSRTRAGRLFIDDGGSRRAVGSRGLGGKAAHQPSGPDPGREGTSPTVRDQGRRYRVVHVTQSTETHIRTGLFGFLARARHQDLADRGTPHDAAGDQLDCTGVHRVGMDEISARKGQDYVSIFADPDARRVVFATEGRSAGTVGRFAAGLVEHGGDPAKVTETSSDMITAFISGTAQHLPTRE
jgi:hypothetical protein